MIARQLALKRGTPRCRQTAVERLRSFDHHFRSPRSAQHVGGALFEVYPAVGRQLSEDPDLPTPISAVPDLPNM